MSDVFRLSGAKSWEPDVDQWLADQPGELGAIALGWFSRLRESGDGVCELMHDGYATVCVGDAAFAYVGVFKAHVNLGFFRGAELEDPMSLLEGAGKSMRHVKLRPSKGDKGLGDAEEQALQKLIAQAYANIKQYQPPR